jgi:hypothetical protein
MSRMLICVLMCGVALAGTAVGSTWPNLVRPTGDQAAAVKVDFDAVFASVNAMRNDYAPALLAQVDFEQVFASVAPPPACDTAPSNGDLLRNAGWERITAAE